MLQVMTDEQVKKAKEEMIEWVTKQLREDTFGLVYQILYNLRQFKGNF